MEKAARKELVNKLLVQIKQTLAEADAQGAEKVNKAARKAARKLVGKFSGVLAKLEKGKKKTKKP